MGQVVGCKKMVVVTKKQPLGKNNRRGQVQLTRFPYFRLPLLDTSALAGGISA